MTDLSSSLKNDCLKIFFVLNGDHSKTDAAGEMQTAFESAKEHFDAANGQEKVKWITVQECLDLLGTTVTKKHVFVFEKFEGSVFRDMCKTKAVIIGPRCLLTCLLKDISVPGGAHPVFTVAMMNLIVCTSGFGQTEKARLMERINWMGGRFTETLSVHGTHLVAKTVKSIKYEKAASNDVIIMKSDWVDAVWNDSLHSDVIGTDKKYNIYLKPMFHELNISSTGLSSSDKNKIEEHVKAHGGVYLTMFKTSVTDVLIMEKSSINSVKYQTAVRYKKDCATPKWIYDSVKIGYALPLDDYKVGGMQSSTPVKLFSSTATNNTRPIQRFNSSNCTVLSEISYAVTQKASQTIDETQTMFDQPNKKPNPLDAAHEEVMEKIDIRTAKKAGSFLDGCNILLFGFKNSEKDKLNKILNSGGATRYDEPNENLTHILVGNMSAEEISSLRNMQAIASIVRVEWLLESIIKKHSVNEDEFLYEFKKSDAIEPQAASPTTKETIQSLENSFKRPEGVRRIESTFTSTFVTKSTTVVENIVSQYGKANVTELTEKGSITFNSELESLEHERLTIFRGLSIFVHVFDEEERLELISDCEYGCAKMVNESFKGTVDYAIVPLVGIDKLNLPVNARHVVTDIWVRDSISKRAVVEIEYIHLPIIIAEESKPLSGCVLVTSAYTSSERAYLNQLGLSLGADMQMNYKKKHKPILLCPLPEGSKFAGAVSWDLPAVNRDWLLACYTHNARVEMKPFLVGATKINEMDEQTAVKVIKKPDMKDFCKMVDDAMLVEIGDEEPTPKEMDSSWSRRIQKLCDDQEQFSQKLKEMTEARTVPSPPSPIQNTEMLAETSSPITPLIEKPHNISDLVLEFPTPNRELIYNTLKEAQNKETPRMRRLRQLIATPQRIDSFPPLPKIPDCVKTPDEMWAFRPDASSSARLRYKRRLEARAEVFGPKLSPPEKKERSSTTTFADIKRQFWREALGDQYVENDGPSKVDDNECSSNPEEVYSEKSDGSSDAIESLRDFIKNRTSEKKTVDKIEDTEADTNVQLHRLDTDFMAPSNAVVGWRDLPEFDSISLSMDASSNTNNKHENVVRRRFIISCADQNRARITSDIEKLKGELCETAMAYDSSCTHIVCELPNRGEKLLSAMAAGKWVLSISYIEESIKAGHFLPEEHFEWGSPIARGLPKLDEAMQPIANAVFRWRNRIATQIDKMNGAFTGFRVLLHVHKREQFQRVIMAGGATVLDIEPPFELSQEAMTATHCFVEVKRKNLSAVDHRTLADAGVRVLDIMYISAYLIDEQLPDASRFNLSVRK